MPCFSLAFFCKSSVSTSSKITYFVYCVWLTCIPVSPVTSAFVIPYSVAFILHYKFSMNQDSFTFILYSCQLFHT
jgi:hypothetical protein